MEGTFPNRYVGRHSSVPTAFTRSPQRGGLGLVMGGCKWGIFSHYLCKGHRLPCTAGMAESYTLPNRQFVQPTRQKRPNHQRHSSHGDEIPFAGSRSHASRRQNHGGHTVCGLHRQHYEPIDVSSRSIRGLQDKIRVKADASRSR